MTKAMALELGQQGIRVNAICPGIVATELADLEYEMVGEAYGVSAAEAAKLLADRNSFKRVGDPGEIGDAVVYLAGPQASFVNGIAMPVSGDQPAGL
jgi:3-oxoacyl-[acyl-carrier protein] reductase